jgi:histidinol-phosphatase (PHP family)
MHTRLCGHAEGEPAAYVELLARYDFEYVIGSVHFLSDGFGFDQSRNMQEIVARGVDSVYCVSYRLVARAAGTGLFDVVGTAVEINTSGWRKPVGEVYPAAALLASAAALGIPLTFGSDAHAPADVGADFDRAVGLARAAGYTATLRLSDRGTVALP